MAEKVILAYSGGLDTSVAIRWIKEKYGMDVITLTIDVGNSKDFEAARVKALKVGAVKAIVIDAKDMFVKYFIWPALQANALYEGQYPLATALSRPLMAKLLVDTALAEAYLSDHYDTYEHKIDAGKRSLCGHEETSPVGEKVWDNPPFDPDGAVTGKVMDSDLAAKMSFIGRAGHPCGEDFIAAPFLAAHPEFAWQKPILPDMKAGPWPQFTANEKPPAAMAQN